MRKSKLSKETIKRICKTALDEDLKPFGDITSKLLNIKKNDIRVKIISNEDGLIGGLEFGKELFKIINKKIKFIPKKKEGSEIKKGDVIAYIIGDIKDILSGERATLNFLSHISGIATETRKFVKAVNKKVKICCTRKTLPGLRSVQKYAVKLGGGTNHRFNLSDEFLIKDNHLALKISIRQIIKKAIKNKKRRKITVEVDNLNQLKSIIGLKFDRVLLDNMSIKQLNLASKLCKNKYETEASGGVKLSNIRKIASTGVDRISIGKLTHSSRSIDLKFEI